MQISNINQLNFRATYPVVHWVAETNGSYAPVANLKITKKLQSKVVRILNKSLDETKKAFMPEQQHLRAYLGGCDIDYRLNPKVRSFYNREEGSINRFSPVSYIISGEDIDIFEDELAKNIGKFKSDAKKIESTIYSDKTIEAIKHYNKEGLNFVNNYKRRIKDKDGMTYVLHTKFEIIRNKLGKIKDYRFVDARFLDEYGPKSPFEKLK